MVKKYVWRNTLNVIRLFFFNIFVIDEKKNGKAPIKNCAYTNSTPLNIHITYITLVNPAIITLSK